MRKSFLVAQVSLGVLFLDLVTKQIVRTNLEYGSDTPLISGFFSLTHSHNKGVAFGFLSELPENIRHPLLLSIPIIAVAIILYLIFRPQEENRLEIFALSLVLGGALGNFINRIWLGYVEDFIHFHWNYEYNFPSFNIADIAICLGVAGLLFVKPASIKYG